MQFSIDYAPFLKAVTITVSSFNNWSDFFKPILDVMYVTSDIHHVLQGLTKLTTYIVHVSATLEDGGETDISEIEFETGKNIAKIL